MLASLTIASIEPLPGQPRKRFDEETLVELAASIAARGVIRITSYNVCYTKLLRR